MSRDDVWKTSEFAGRVVLVTGAASGIGEATARAFAASGARVALFDIDADSLVRVHGDLDAGGVGVISSSGDVAGEDAVAFAERVAEAWGAIDVLVNCAVSFIAEGADATRDHWRRVMDVNVIGPAILTARVAEFMPPGGAIVNVSSISAHAAQPNRWTYNASKAAILALTRGQALDLQVRGIRVNAVSPGWIWTPEVARAAGNDRATWEPRWGQYHILNRLGEPDEVAQTVMFLAGSQASFITGTEIFVDGGYNALGPEGRGSTSVFAGTE